LYPIVEPTHRDDLVNTLVDIVEIGGVGAGTRRIPLFLPGDQCRGNTPAHRTGLHEAFFVAETPEKNAGPAPVPKDQPAKLVEILFAAVEQPVLVAHQQPKTVTGIEPFGG